MAGRYTKMTEEEKAERRKKRDEDWVRTVKLISYIPDANGGATELSRCENGVWYDNATVSQSMRDTQALKIDLACANAILKPLGYRAVQADGSGHLTEAEISCGN